MGEKPTSPEANVFRDVFCATYFCAPEAFTEKVFLRCFFPHALPFGLLLCALNAPSTNRAKLAIQKFGDASTPRQVNAVVDEYYRYIEDSGGFWIRFFKVRLSGTRLIQLYNQTMRQAQHSSSIQPPAPPN